MLFLNSASASKFTITGLTHLFFSGGEGGGSKFLPLCDKKPQSWMEPCLNLRHL